MSKTTSQRLAEIVRQFQADHPDALAEFPDGPTRPDGLARGIWWAVRQYDHGAPALPNEAPSDACEGGSPPP